jgi:radical SAM superfamily enzyme YgiQ (UPF0313 family)
MSYWGFQHSLEIVGRRASLPPLGLLTVAALLPSEWEVRLVDMNVRALEDEEIIWADVVLVSGMLIQQDSMLEVIERSRAKGTRVVVGGPAPTTAPELFARANGVFRHEAEGRVDELLSMMEGSPSRPRLEQAARFPDMRTSPTPRYELLEMRAYASMSIQYSRGCPFRCEFCDVTQIFGNAPRVKDPNQVLAELDAIYELGHRGTVFFVDDNFIGNRRSARKLLPRIQAWQRERGFPFELYTEASVNLAADVELTQSMVSAGFTSVFVGIETPSESALRSVNKLQNLRCDLKTSVETLTEAGLEVMGGFIVGFDTDEGDVFAAQSGFLESAPIPAAMVGLLNALPGTDLSKRLENEGRMRTESSGDQFGRPNFEPVMDESELLRGYAQLLRELYSPSRYYARCWSYINLARPNALDQARSLRDLRDFGRAIWRVGVRSPRRWRFWRLLMKTLRVSPTKLKWAVVHAIQGEHLIRYTSEVVLPRLERALLEVRPVEAPRIALSA